MNYSGFPVTYQPMMPMQYQPTIQPQAPNISNSGTNNGIVWVQGEAGAKAYPVAPGNSLLLMDSEAHQFYIKSTDQSGMPMPLRIFSYEEVLESVKNSDSKDFITRDEFEKRISELTVKPNRVKKEVKEDE